MAECFRILKSLARNSYSVFLDPETGLVRTYLDDFASPPDPAATALFVANIYNLAMLLPLTRLKREFGKLYLGWADDRYHAVQAQVNPDTGLLGPEPSSAWAQCCYMMMLGARQNPRTLGLVAPPGSLHFGSDW